MPSEGARVETIEANELSGNMRLDIQCGVWGMSGIIHSVEYGMRVAS